MSIASQVCWHVGWETKLGLTIAQSKLALSYFHLRYLVLFSKAEPNPFSPPLPVPLGRKVMLCLPPSSGRLCNWHRLWEWANCACVLSAGCGKDPQARGPVLGLDSLQQAGEKERRVPLPLLDLSPGP